MVENHDLAFQHVHILVMKPLHHIVVWQQLTILVLTNEHFQCYDSHGSIVVEKFMLVSKRLFEGLVVASPQASHTLSS